MLHEFLTNSRQELIERCRSKASQRLSPVVSPSDLVHGVPIFLDQLIAALQREQDLPESQRAKPRIGGAAPSPGAVERSSTASLHGKQLLETGYTVEQVVHGYGDICQSITELAKEKKAPVTVDEFHTFNRLLDNAIADAVSSFGRHRDKTIQFDTAHGLHERIGLLGDELRRHVDTALSALDAIKFGQIGVMGTTGSVLEDSLITLRELVDKSLPEIRLETGVVQPAGGTIGDKPR